LKPSSTNVLTTPLQTVKPFLSLTSIATYSFGKGLRPISRPAGYYDSIIGKESSLGLKNSRTKTPDRKRIAVASETRITRFKPILTVATFLFGLAPLPGTISLLA